MAPELAIDSTFRTHWCDAWDEPPAFLTLPVLHPSAQNMSPFARADTLFHTRMLDTRDALIRTARSMAGFTVPAERPEPPTDGIYALPEWRHLVAPRHARYDALWRAHGV